MSKKKKKVCYLYICDASGSMSDKISEVQGELKQFFADMRKESKVKPTIIVTDFSSRDDFNVLCNCLSPKKLKDQTIDKYSARGMTALYDAIVKSFNLIDDEKYDGVYVSILTDGWENDSHTSLMAVQELIKDKRSKGWGIVFSGTTEEALKGAQVMGMSVTNTLGYANTAKGLKLSGKVRSASRTAYTVNTMVANDRSEIDNDNLVADLDEQKEDKN